MPLPFLILLWPLAEIAAFSLMAGAIGGFNTFLLQIAATIAGMTILRRQGLAGLMALRQDGTGSELPVGTVLDGLAVSLAGLLLFIPGLITDALGLVLLVPSIRHSIGAWLVQNFARTGHFRGTGGFHSQTRWGSPEPGGGPGAGPGNAGSETTIIDVAYTEIRNEDEPSTKHPRLGPSK